MENIHIYTAPKYFFYVSEQKTFFALEKNHRLFKMGPKVAAPAVEFICKCIRLFAFFGGDMEFNRGPPERGACIKLVIGFINEK